MGEEGGAQGRKSGVKCGEVRGGGLVGRVLDAEVDDLLAFAIVSDVCVDLCFEVYGKIGREACLEFCLRSPCARVALSGTLQHVLLLC